jgi:hypothetical protein
MNLPLRHNEHTTNLALLELFQAENLLVEVASPGQVLDKTALLRANR